MGAVGCLLACFGLLLLAAGILAEIFGYFGYWIEWIQIAGEPTLPWIGLAAIGGFFAGFGLALAWGARRRKARARRPVAAQPPPAQAPDRQCRRCGQPLPPAGVKNCPRCGTPASGG